MGNIIPLKKISLKKNKEKWNNKKNKFLEKNKTHTLINTNKIEYKKKNITKSNRT